MLIEENLIDQTFIDSRTNDWQATRELARSIRLMSPRRSAACLAQKIVDAALLYGRAKTSMPMHAGIEHHKRCEQRGCHTSTGAGYRQDRRTGLWLRNYHRQGNGQVDASMAGKADQLPGQRSITNPEHRKYVSEV